MNVHQVHLVHFITHHLIIYLSACSITFNVNIDYKFYISYLVYRCNVVHFNCEALRTVNGFCAI